MGYHCRRRCVATLGNQHIFESFKLISLSFLLLLLVSRSSRESSSGPACNVWKLLPKHAFEAEFRDASRSSMHMLADVSRPTSPNPCARQTDTLASQRLSEMWDFSLRSKAASEGFSESLCFDDVFAARLSLEYHWCFPSWRMWHAI